MDEGLGIDGKAADKGKNGNRKEGIKGIKWEVTVDSKGRRGEKGMPQCSRMHMWG